MKRCKKIVMNAGFELGLVPASSKYKMVKEKKIVEERELRVRLE
jgi:hypothetical protein